MTRREAARVDAVVDLPDALGTHADLLFEEVFQVVRHCHVPVDERRVQPAQQRRLQPRPVQIRHVPAVLPVHAPRHAGQPGGQQRVEAGQVARMHDGRAQLAAKPEQLAAQSPDADARAMQRDHRHFRPRDALTEGRVVLHAGDRVPVAIGGHVVDEVDQAVLHATDDEVVDHVQHQRRTFGAHRRPRHSRRKARSLNSQWMPRRRTSYRSIRPMLEPP